MNARIDAPQPLRRGIQPRPLRPPLRVVPPGERSARARQRRARLLVFAGASILATVVFGLVGVHVSLAQNQLRLDRLNVRSAAEASKYESLRLQVAQLESPSHIVDEARKQGMVSPPGITYLLPPPAPAPASSTATTVPAGATPAVSDWTSLKHLLTAHP
jgi:cell division protein FtsL